MVICLPQVQGAAACRAVPVPTNPVCPGRRGCGGGKGPGSAQISPFGMPQLTTAHGSASAPHGGAAREPLWIGITGRDEQTSVALVPAPAYLRASPSTATGFVRPSMSMAPSTTGSARLSKLGRTAEAGDACQTALTLGPP